MSKIVVRGRKFDGEVIEGTGFNVVCGSTHLYKDYVWYDIDSSSLRIRTSPELEKYPNPKMTKENVSELHELLVQTVINFCREKNIDEVDEVSFGADGLEDSIKFGKWTPSTDSSLRVTGIHDGKKKEIGYNI